MMPDISMCTTKDCPKSKTCKRHTDSGTVPCEYWQTYADFNPDGCEYYYPIKEDE